MSAGEFEKCLRKNQIKKDPGAVRFVLKELEQAAIDLKSAKATIKTKNYKWVIIQYYYSMFHSARALLYNKSYREKSHFCLISSLREFYVSEGKLSYKQVEALQLAKTLRENADYYGNFTKESAENLISEAESFLVISSEIVGDKK